MAIAKKIKKESSLSVNRYKKYKVEPDWFNLVSLWRKGWDTAINRRTMSVKGSPSKTTEPMGTNQSIYRNKKRHQMVSNFVGGKDGIRTHVPETGQPHFECGSL